MNAITRAIRAIFGRNGGASSIGGSAGVFLGVSNLRAPLA